MAELVEQCMAIRTGRDSLITGGGTHIHVYYTSTYLHVALFQALPLAMIVVQVQGQRSNNKNLQQYKSNIYRHKVTYLLTCTVVQGHMHSRARSHAQSCKVTPPFNPCHYLQVKCQNYSLRHSPFSLCCSLMLSLGLTAYWHA